MRLSQIGRAARRRLERQRVRAWARPCPRLNGRGIPAGLVEAVWAAVQTPGGPARADSEARARLMWRLLERDVTQWGAADAARAVALIASDERLARALSDHQEAVARRAARATGVWPRWTLPEPLARAVEARLVLDGGWETWGARRLGTWMIEDPNVDAGRIERVTVALCTPGPTGLGPAGLGPAGLGSTGLGPAGLGSTGTPLVLAEHGAQTVAGLQALLHAAVYTEHVALWQAAWTRLGDAGRRRVLRQLAARDPSPGVTGAGWSGPPSRWFLTHLLGERGPGAVRWSLRQLVLVAEVPDPTGQLLERLCWVAGDLQDRHAGPEGDRAQWRRQQVAVVRLLVRRLVRRPSPSLSPRVLAHLHELWLDVGAPWDVPEWARVWAHLVQTDARPDWTRDQRTEYPTHVGRSRGRLRDPGLPRATAVGLLRTALALGTRAERLTALGVLAQLDGPRAG